MIVTAWWLGDMCPGLEPDGETCTDAGVEWCTLLPDCFGPPDGESSTDEGVDWCILLLGSLDTGWASAGTTADSLSLMTRLAMAHSCNAGTVSSVLSDAGNALVGPGAAECSMALEDAMGCGARG